MRPYNADRLPGVTEKIPKEETGLKAAIYCHFYMHPDTGAIDELRISDPKREDSSLEKILTALGDHVTQILRDHAKAKSQRG